MITLTRVEVLPPLTGLTTTRQPRQQANTSEGADINFSNSNLFSLLGRSRAVGHVQLPLGRGRLLEMLHHFSESWRSWREGGGFGLLAKFVSQFGAKLGEIIPH